MYQKQNWLAQASIDLTDKAEGTERIGIVRVHAEEGA